MLFRIIDAIGISLLLIILLSPSSRAAECGDVNGSNGVDIDDVVYLINYIFASGPPPCFGENPGGTLTFYSNCKYHDRGAPMEYPQNQECIVWNYNVNGKLTFTHVNTVFNCCPLELRGWVYINGSSIHIVEEEIFEFEPCPCMCLYDMEYELTDILPGTYTVYFENPYLPSEDWLLTIINVETDPVGEFCIERFDYPWVE